jgi:hypothetical protein
MFRLTKEEKDGPVTNCDRLRRLKHSSALPRAFTEQGVSINSLELKWVKMGLVLCPQPCSMSHGGAYLGIGAIPEDWVTRIEKSDYLDDLATRLAEKKGILTG